VKRDELLMNKKPKLITFTIEESIIGDNFYGPTESVKFEIEGGGDIVTCFVRKNEEEFFEFINDFSQGKS